MHGVDLICGGAEDVKGEWAMVATSILRLNEWMSRSTVSVTNDCKLEEEQEVCLEEQNRDIETEGKPHIPTQSHGKRLRSFSVPRLDLEAI